MKVSRRQFIERILCVSAGALGSSAVLNSLACSDDTVPSLSSQPSALMPAPNMPPPAPPPAALAGISTLFVARGQSPKAITEAAIKAAGGIEKYVKVGNDVIIKPNIGPSVRSFEYAATTNPEVVAALVKLCIGAGAKRVRVMDNPFGSTAQQGYARSGIADAVKAAGGEMEIMSQMKFRDTDIPNGKDIKSWPVYQDILDADVVINVPIAKHHSLARLTLSMKNLMGVIGRPNMFHINLGQRVADLCTRVQPTLTVIDAVRILTNHGPTGGDLSDVKLMNTVIVGTDMVAADTYAAAMFGLKGEDIPIIRAAAQMGLGTMDMKSIKIEEFSV